jgi:protein phosphatase
LIVLMGASGSGKSTFARRHFAPAEVLSSDAFRALVGDDENDLSVTEPAFQALYHVAAARLGLGRLTVVDATSVTTDARRPLVQLAGRHGAVAVAIVLDVPARVCLERNERRPDRTLPSSTIRRQLGALRRSVGGLGDEGFGRVIVLRGVDDVNGAEVLRDRPGNASRGRYPAGVPAQEVAQPVRRRSNRDA